MLNEAIRRVRTAMKYANDAGTYEVTEILKPLEEVLTRRKCRMDMEFNGMTGYCRPCCGNWDKCHDENGFGVDGANVAFGATAPGEVKEPKKKAGCNGRSVGTDNASLHCVGDEELPKRFFTDNGRNWFANTGEQPSEPAKPLVSG